jgi:hypothetical protein
MSLVVAGAFADQVTLEPILDNTLCEDAAGAKSNGLGEYFFAGRTDQLPGFAIRRGLLAFDVAGTVPSPAIIESVQLTLEMSRTEGAAVSVALHLVLGAWGEGPSDAPGEEGGCTTAESGDATWLFTFWPTLLWNRMGGDFSVVASATQIVADEGPYTWSTAQMVADVQSWLDDPAGNFGWIVLGEESGPQTSKRFNSRQNRTVSTRPKLTIEFSPAIIFADGFESGDTSAWSSTVP